MEQNIALVSTLLQTPLFLGMTQYDMQEIVGLMKFGFSKHAEDELIVKEYDECKSLYFLLNGTLAMTTSSADGSYTITEVLHAPQILQPERLFGLKQRFSAEYRAVTPCNMMYLGKSDVQVMFHAYEVFRINLVNAIATLLQRQEEKPWAFVGNSLRSRIYDFMRIHCHYPAGEKHIKIKMVDLARIMNETRLTISHELRRMEEEGLITLSRGMIHVPALERLSNA